MKAPLTEVEEYLEKMTEGWEERTRAIFYEDLAWMCADKAGALYFESPDVEEDEK